MLTKDTKISEAIFRDASLIPVIYRFGIKLGVGDDTIEEICLKHDMDVNFFLAIVNTYINADYMPEDVEDIFKTSVLLHYLETTDAYYLNTQIPNIERHFKLLLQYSPQGNNLDLIFKFFLEMKAQIEECRDADANKWFPMINRKIEDTIYVADRVEIEGDYIDLLPDDLGKAFSRRTEIEEKINDLASIFVVHLKGDYDANLCMAVVNAIFLLRKDVCQNNRIRNRILLPAVLRLFGINS